MKLEEEDGIRSRCILGATQNTKLTIGVISRGSMHHRMVESLLATDFSFLGEHAKPAIAIVTGSLVGAERDWIASMMLGDLLLFIDDDMTWEPDAIARLVATREEHDLDVVGGLYYSRRPPGYLPVMFRNNAQELGNHIVEDWEPGSLVEVDATGAGFLLIHHRVFDKITGRSLPRWRVGVPWPEDMIVPFFVSVGNWGEDMFFCRSARKAGCRIAVDTSVVLGHIGEIEVGHQHYLEFMANESSPFAASERLAMGLPALTPAEARRRLKAAHHPLF